jgi:hypothetical protein
MQAITKDCVVAKAGLRNSTGLRFPQGFSHAFAEAPLYPDVDSMTQL